MLESLFHKIADLFSPATLKRNSNTRIFLWNLQNFLKRPILKNICGWATASLNWNMAYEFSIILSYPSILRNSTANSEVSTKMKIMSLVLEWILVEILFFVFYLLWRHHSPAAEKNVQASSNEVKTCGLVQQLILRMLRDLILQSHDLYSLDVDSPNFCKDVWYQWKKNKFWNC